ncbi:hypothetical protein IWT25_02309 [Secundilactobacillus pentosiphilus]|uniref:YopX protein domain-containing protein n=1 Tax=Secundilactobacillus pentosiphilus TaxID=1714682 RepID=A0A1Z5IZR3_9LACO|nr:YopX family protein [Secundilactobacillus pentosiphilus]GAX06961.1 hypothetical protein IWT25_02309 [Secundilactobacillus pentosiphilus]
MKNRILRAWVKKQEKYYQVKQINFASKTITVKDFLIKEKTFKFNEVVLERYTRLADMKERQICEGDILHWHNPTNFSVDNYGIVRWLTISFLLDTSGKWALYKPAHFLENYACRMEIVGNIHQNPELLQKNIWDSTADNVWKKFGGLNG